MQGNFSHFALRAAPGTAFDAALHCAASCSFTAISDLDKQPEGESADARKRGSDKNNNELKDAQSLKCEVVGGREREERRPHSALKPRFFIASRI